MCPILLHTQSLADLFTLYQDDVLCDAAPMTRYQHKLFTAMLLRQWGNVAVETITPEVLRAWKGELTCRLRAGSVRRYMKMLSAYLRFAVDDLGWLEVHPMERIKKPSLPPAVVRYLTTDERAALLTTCQQSFHPYLYAIVLLALSTGGRKNELRCLPWQAVDLELRVVRFLKTKTKLARTVPLAGEIVGVLRDLWIRRKPAVPWVFPAKSGRKATYMETAWRQARLQAGVMQFRFHDLRHTFASYMAMSGASLRDIAELLGHVRIEQTMAYAHLMPAHTRGKVEAMMEQFLA